MLLHAVNKNPGPRDLLVFGLGLPVVFAALGYTLYRPVGDAWAAKLVWGLGASASLLFAGAPSLRRAMYIGWMYAVYPIGWIVSHAMMAILYFAVITPVGLVMRLLGRDAMNRRFDASATSYWVKRPPPPGLKQYFRPY